MRDEVDVGRLTAVRRGWRETTAEALQCLEARRPLFRRIADFECIVRRAA